MNASPTPFEKWNALGNDFIVVDARARPFAWNAALVRRLADRTHGIGCDQLIIVEPADGADAFMRILNADGSEVAACGNATRCIASRLSGELGRPDVTIATAAGILPARVDGDLVRVDMGLPRFGWADIPLSHDVGDTARLPLALGDGLPAPSAINVGNPHCVFFVADIAAHDLATIGPQIETHALFPERVNVSLCEVVDAGRIALRVWERGVGITQACGTAACAAAGLAIAQGRTSRRVAADMPGGTLLIDWPDGGSLAMSGPSTFEYAGRIDIATIAA